MIPLNIGEYFNSDPMITALAEKLRTPKAALEWVHNRIEYESEPRWRDTWKKPIQTLKDLKGDCEDMSLLLAAILLRMKIPVRLVYGLLGGRPHVWVETIPEGKYVFEPTSGKMIPWEKRFDEGYLELAYISPASYYPQPASPIGILAFVMSQVNRGLEKAIKMNPPK